MKTIAFWSLMMTLSLLAASWASVPPPPVNQIIGLPDGVSNDLTEAGCRICHENPAIVNPGTISDRHHQLLGDIIIDPTVSPYGTPGETYQCQVCHKMHFSPGYYFNFRDCILCHQQIPGQASVHHITIAADAQDCKACHEPIDNPLDDHFIPEYEPSMVTPFPGLGTGENGRGGCKFCHGTGTDAEFGDTIFSNFDTHHSTGIGQEIIPGSALDCSLCHDFQADEDFKIRVCEKCHAPSSLHNIQIDSNGDGRVEPGSEKAYFGHIGNNEDCLGCHFGSYDFIMDTRSIRNNPDRHHQMIITRGMECLDCHSLVINEKGIFEFENFRFCSNCHGGNHRRR
ncbi:MAG: hypothetical protein JW786_00795 [Desulfobacterales bacterium]|nr:hypothetical protein [Desulfobacterales bacterium]